MSNRYESNAAMPTVHVSLAALFLAGFGSNVAAQNPAPVSYPVTSGAVYDNEAVRSARSASALQQPVQKVVSDSEFVAAATSFYTSLAQSQQALDADVAARVHEKLWDMYCD